VFCTSCGEQEVRIPSAGRKGEPKNPCELKDDTNSAREDKQVCYKISCCVFLLDSELVLVSMRATGVLDYFGDSPNMPVQLNFPTYHHLTRLLSSSSSGKTIVHCNFSLYFLPFD
jgi:hypothetical protein